MGIIGYKVFNPDWTCKGFQYEVGKIFVHEGPIEMCGSGFHFCLKLSDCFNYYEFNSANKVASVEAIGDVITEGDKSVTNEIKIVKELSWHEVLDMCNTGNCNTGNCNTGNCNTGNCNTGNRNTGKYNTGNCNTGNCNTGNRNTGNWNATNYSTGFFNSIEQPFYIFNKPSLASRREVYDNIGYYAMRCYYSCNTWVPDTAMTEKEKEQNPEYSVTGGYLKTVDHKTACEIMWGKMSDEEKAAVKDLPNFDADIFEEITGIHVD